MGDRRKKRKSMRDSIGSVPECLCVLGTAVGDRFKVGGAGVVAECLSGVHEHDAVCNFTVKSGKIRRVLDLTESVGDVVVANINVETGVRYAEIPNPGKSGNECAGESKSGLVCLVGPIVNSVAPAVRPTGSVADDPRVFVRMLEVDDAVRRLLHVFKEVHAVWVKHQRAAPSDAF